ncbi:hypothetical protein AB0N16_37230 [Streptomyces sp. NPDC051105]|uniref:hypothetical protein n=1 Tax=Streptomyces sp. NPDC051105 TaxID=3154843 RepID=UPI003419E074
MTTSAASLSAAYDLPWAEERTDRVVARHRPEFRAAIRDRVIGEDRRTGSPEMRAA